jgi:hypothetical protein
VEAFNLTLTLLSLLNPAPFTHQPGTLLRSTLAPGCEISHAEVGMFVIVM